MGPASPMAHPCRRLSSLSPPEGSYQQTPFSRAWPGARETGFKSHPSTSSLCDFGQNAEPLCACAFLAGNDDGNSVPGFFKRIYLIPMGTMRAKQCVGLGGLFWSMRVCCFANSLIVPALGKYLLKKCSARSHVFSCPLGQDLSLLH